MVTYSGNIIHGLKTIKHTDDRMAFTTTPWNHAAVYDPELNMQFASERDRYEYKNRQEAARYMSGQLVSLGGIGSAGQSSYGGASTPIYPGQVIRVDHIGNGIYENAYAGGVTATLSTPKKSKKLLLIKRRK